MRRLLLVPHYRVPATLLELAKTYAAAVYGIWQGVAILSSSPARFGSPAFDTIRDHLQVFGATALIGGLGVLLGMLLHRFAVKALGLLTLSSWSLAFGFATLNAYLTNPTAAPTGPPVYIFIAVVLAILVWVDADRRLAGGFPETSSS